MIVEIMDAKRRHCGPMARALRVGHDMALRQSGTHIHRAIRLNLSESHYAKVAVVDGYLSAMWGMCGGALSSDGLVWLVLSQHIVRHPVAIGRFAKAEFARMAEGKRSLSTTVIPSDDKAMRFARFLGLRQVGEGIPWGSGGYQIPMLYIPENA